MAETYEKQLASLEMLYTTAEIYHKMLSQEVENLPREIYGPAMMHKQATLHAMASFAHWKRVLQEDLSLLKTGGR